MLFQCWPTVFDAGPTLKQHWVNAPCILEIDKWQWRKTEGAINWLVVFSDGLFIIFLSLVMTPVIDRGFVQYTEPPCFLLVHSTLVVMIT